jgi:putative endonuclease
VAKVTAPFLFWGGNIRHSRAGGNPWTADRWRRNRTLPWIPAFAGMTKNGMARMEKRPAVYILASGKHGTLYIGVTSDLLGRIHQHRESLIKGFTSRYGVTRLVRFESFGDMASAIAREKQLKKWNRGWKIELIEEANPHWDDLAVTMLGFPPLGD